MTGPWAVVYRDTDKFIEKRPIGRNAEGVIFEERTTWTNPNAPEYRLTAVEAKVDTVEAAAKEPA